MAWSADGQYLFYLDKHPETLLAYRVMRHRLGTSTRRSNGGSGPSPYQRSFHGKQ